MKQLPIDLAELAMAMTNTDGSYYLNTDTGELTWLSEWGDDNDEEGAERREEIDASEAWVSVPTLETHEAYRRMERFVASVDESDVRERLEVALQGKGAFRRFKDVLAGYPDLRERWFEEQEQIEEQSARDWLATLQIESTWKRPPKPVKSAPLPTPKRPDVRLEHVLVLGAPDGRTEVIDGQVSRFVPAASEADARAIYRFLVQQLCDWNGLGYRKAMVQAPEFKAGGIEISVSKTGVEVIVDVPKGVVKRFFEG